MPRAQGAVCQADRGFVERGREARKAESHKEKKGDDMAQALDLPKLIDEVRNALAGTAKNAVQRLWGEAGPPWGTSFAELEDLAVQIGRILGQQLLAQAVPAQAQATPPATAFLRPTCGRVTASAEQPEPRALDTDTGPVAWREPAASCGSCRKASFPSE